MANDHRQKQEKGSQFTTLAALIRHFVGLELKVELKNGKTYHGYLEEGDDDMNVVLSTGERNLFAADNNTNGDSDDHSTGALVSAECHHTVNDKNYGRDCHRQDQEQQEQKQYQQYLQLGPFHYAKIHIRGSAIRYIHFPDNVDLSILIKLGLDRQRAAHNKYARGKRQKR